MALSRQGMDRFARFLSQWRSKLFICGWPFRNASLAKSEHQTAAYPQFADSTHGRAPRSGNRLLLDNFPNEYFAGQLNRGTDKGDLHVRSHRANGHSSTGKYRFRKVLSPKPARM